MSTGHPSNFGFVQCGWCRTWIPRSTAREDIPCAELPFACADATWCGDRCTERERTPGFDANGSEAP